LVDEYQATKKAMKHSKIYAQKKGNKNYFRNKKKSVSYVHEQYNNALINREKNRHKM